MKIDLAQYLRERYLERNAPEFNPGPVITIAREMGCPGKKVAQKLQDRLNDMYKIHGLMDEWKWIGKEIFDKAAKELELEPANIRKIFKKKRSIISEILSSQSQKYYINDRRIRKTIGETIRSIANDGHAIILGRGGVALTRDIPRSLHIFLEAPLEWRASLIAEKCSYTIDEARQYAIETDKQRLQYRQYFRGKNNDYTSYDITFNCMTLSVDEIVEIIVKAIQIRKIIPIT